MIITKEEIEAVLAGCDGVTPGPWENHTGFVRSRHHGETIQVSPSATIQTSTSWVAECRDGEAFYDWEANAAHIARLSPEFVRDLATLALEALSSREAGWQGIETAPRDGGSIMVFVQSEPLQAAHCFAPISICDDGSWWDDSTGDQIDPLPLATHWMPLPNPPDQGSK